MKNIWNSLTGLLVVLFIFSGCGSDSADSSDSPDGGIPAPVLATGQFKDSNTAGLKYVSGGQSGITSADGTFTYEVGTQVTFSIGGVTLGSTTGRATVTPIHLVLDGNSTNTQVRNIVRFLMMLDLDSDPSNGITISQAVQNVAENWNQIDLSTLDLPNEVATLITDVNVADSVTTHILPSDIDASAHLETTLRCTNAGIYTGTFSGDDQGYISYMVDAQTGFLTGKLYSTLNNQNMTISGTVPISYDEDTTFVVGVSSGAQIIGTITSSNQMTGTWTNAGDSGTGVANRIGGSSNALYRFNGDFSGANDSGFFSIDVDASNTVTGYAYSNIDNASLQISSGSVSGTVLTATLSNGTTVSGILDTSNGSLSGTWNATDGSTGIFTGSGCRLN